MISKVFILSPNCVIVNGHLRSVLIDLQKQNFKLISDDLVKLISKPIPEKTLTSFIGETKEFVDSLLAEDILLPIPKQLVSLFPSINNQFHNVSEINNAIIELNSHTIYFENRIVESLNNLGCKFIEIRVSGEIEICRIDSFLKIISTTTIECVDLFFQYKNNNTYDELLKLKNNVLEVRWIYMYNTPRSFVEKMKKKVQPGTLMLTGNAVDKKNCGNISPFYFAINIPTYTESVHYNSCLNCKISIDKDGEIRHCPSMNKSYGNIKNTSLEEAVQNKNFEEYGRIKKDEVKVCKDCEFRYICTDCRAYVENPEDKYSKPLKCGYNPYTGFWEEWSTNPLKQKAIKHYGMEELVKALANP